MKETFSIEAQNGKQLLLVDHHFFLDLLNENYSSEQRHRVQQAVKNYVPQGIIDARKVNSKYRLFIGNYAINVLKEQADSSFRRIVEAYLGGFMDPFHTATYFNAKQDPQPGDVDKHELEFYRNLVKEMKSSNVDGEEQQALLLTSYPNAQRLADRLIDTGLTKIISFSPEHGFVECKIVEPQEGDLVYIGGKPLPLQKRFGGGGEADIFELVPGKLAKVYKTVPDIQTHLPNCFKFQEEMRQRSKRLDVLLNNPKYNVQDRHIVLPQYQLTDADGNLVGIVMDQVEGILLVDIITKNKYPFEGFKRSDLLTIAKKIIVKFKKLHSHGIIMGDVNLENILVDAKSADDIKIYIIDLDSCQIDGFPSTFETPEFTDPLWLQQREKHGFIPRTIENECFTLMILLFNIIFNNVHPYQHPTGRNLKENTAERLYPYKIQDRNIEYIQQEFGVRVANDPNKGEKKAPTFANYTHSHLPKYMKCLLYITFAKQGNDFRPSTDQMIRALDGYIHYLRKNPENDKMVYDNFAIGEDSKISFKCASKSCQKDYYYHYDKVFKTYKSNEKYLYCNDCINMYDTQIKKLLNDERISQKERDDLKKEWEESLTPQNLEKLLTAFFNDSTKKYNREHKLDFEQILKHRQYGAQATVKQAPVRQTKPATTTTINPTKVNVTPVQPKKPAPQRPTQQQKAQPAPDKNQPQSLLKSILGIFGR